MNLFDINTLAVLDIETVGVCGTFEELKDKYPRLASLWTERSKWLKDRYNNNTELSVSELWELKSGLHAEFAKVICITFGVFDEAGGPHKLVSYSGDDEVEILTSANTVLNRIHSQGRVIAGHTIERFDLPFMWKRMLVNKIRPAEVLTTWNKKPWQLTHFDVAKFWSGGAWQEGFTSLDTMSALFDVKSPKAEMQASRVHNIYWMEGGIEKIKDYCEGDVTVTMDVIKILSDI
jgi:hypothetical protein